jgi:hypothetical protein
MFETSPEAYMISGLVEADQAFCLMWLKQIRQNA